MIPDPLCLICHGEPETPELLFLLCPWTKQVWSDSYLRVAPSPRKISRINKWFFETLTSDNNPPSKERLAGTLWQIWKRRNNLVFQGKAPRHEEITEEARLELELFNRWNQKTKARSKGVAYQPAVWVPPAKGTLKYNVDGSWRNEQERGSAVGIYRNARSFRFIFN
ncbi:hypothetical protein ACJRO7_031000 [Eucalyptus globulus]|uniref:Reverse transcriptase zinc-binding domain-containing protein n=1 Tax=Eucalyptus globulus TaxID=34317 RepID=A0ABD3JFQ8_EUCGL